MGTGLGLAEVNLHLASLKRKRDAARILRKLMANG
jgi:hypothetical protein